jgi:hypothetical protein
MHGSKVVFIHNNFLHFCSHFRGVIKRIKMKGDIVIEMTKLMQDIKLQ